MGKAAFQAKAFFNPDGHQLPVWVPVSVFLREQTMNKLDHIDQSYLDKAAQLRSKFQRPDMGDFVLFPTGQLERFSHDWDVGIQTSPGGSYYLQPMDTPT